MTNDQTWITITIVWFLAVCLMISAGSRPKEKHYPVPSSRKVSSEIIGLQATCSEKAEEYFKEHYFAETDKSINHTSYYNRKLDKCFILVNEDTWGRDVNNHSMDLIEVFEDRPYGRFLQSSDKSESWDPASPQECWVQDRDDRCKTIREFIDKFVAPYMKG
jgi:hypothetical protein